MSITSTAAAALMAATVAVSDDANTTTTTVNAVTLTAAPAAPFVPTFKLLNHDENWSVLADPAKRTTPWANIKYIPVADGYLSLGGEARWRAEYRNHERFGRGLQDNDGLYQQRLRLWADYNPTDNVRVFAEVQDTRTADIDSGEPVTETSHADIHQAFVEVKGKVANGTLKARVGRQEFGLGSYRLFDIREGANTRSAFDMTRIMYDAPTGWSGGVFGGYALRESRHSFDDVTNYDYRVFGATASRRLGGATGPKLELLYANTDRQGVAFDTGLAGRDDRDTVSVRVDGRKGVFDYDVEGVIQRGDFRGLDIEAWYVSATLGQTFDAAWSPRVAVRIDAASGDKNRNDGKLNTFNALNAAPISMRTDLGVANLVSIQPQVTFKPYAKTTVGLLTAGLWRQSDQDGVYLTSGMPVRSGTEGNSSYVGWRYAGFATYAVKPHVTLTGVANYTKAGAFLKETGAKDQSYAGVILGLKF